MPSPFPGMDPYIEACGLWEDFHHHFIEQVGQTLADTAPARYLVRTGERSYVVFVESEGKRERPLVPDVSLTAPERRKRPPKKSGATAIAEVGSGVKPVVLRAFIDERHRETFVEIYEATPEQRLVTAIEVLSPSNKRANSPGWDLYLRKRQSRMLEGVNLVEVDLLRGGTRMPMLDPWPANPYTVMVARANEPDACLVWPAHFQEPLPPIPVPLAKPDPDITLDLQPLINAIYQRYRYAQSIAYTRPLKPPLSTQEAAWLKKRLRGQQG